MSELEVELEQLSTALDEKGVELRGVIKEEKRRKEVELQVNKLLYFIYICFIKFFLFVVVIFLIYISLYFPPLFVSDKISRKSFLIFKNITTVFS